MKYDVVVEATLESILQTKRNLEDSFDIDVSDKDIETVHAYIAESTEFDGLANLLYDLGIVTDAYITYAFDYNPESNLYIAEMLFDGNYFGMALIIEDGKVTLFNDFEFANEGNQ